MFKPSKNPKIEELTKSHTERRINLSGIRVTVVDGVRKCVWCMEGTLHSKNQKYCTSACSDAIFAWANPQTDNGLLILLVRQAWKCNLCAYDWAPLAESIWTNMNTGYSGYDPETQDFRTHPNWVLSRRLKDKSPEGTKPEVDHIIPISKGGTSLGFDNHQAICYTCHKVKTKVDNSGPRKKKPVSP